jgi:ferredoxin
MTAPNPTRIQLKIDGHEVQVDRGQTVLDAARQLGLNIPTLCHLDRCGPMTSCLACVVKVKAAGRSRIVPSCGTRAEPGMVVESETEEVHELRRGALELLFSDHVGDCLSPCQRICPLDLNIPSMLRQIQANQLDAAVRTVRQSLALPAVLGRLCHAPCQNGCRRSTAGGSAAIRDLERFVADHDLQQPNRHLPPRKPRTGKLVAIVGAGPTGLAAAYQLLLDGHECTLFDRQEQPGGSLRQIDDSNLPASILTAEIQAIEQLGARFQTRTEIGRSPSVDELSRQFHAVLIATGQLPPASADLPGLDRTATGLTINPLTHQTDRANVFAAGSAVKPIKQLVRAMAEGRDVAGGIHQFLRGQPVRLPAKPLSSVMGRIGDVELAIFLKTANPAPRTVPSAGLRTLFAPTEAQSEAARCLHCDCRSAGNCRLQEYAQIYGANPNRFARERRPFEQHLHPARVIFEPGKCILCGICIHIAQQAAEPLGLTFVQRGFNVQVAAPMGRPFADGLQKVAVECVECCPTGAIAFQDNLQPAQSRAEP